MRKRDLPKGLYRQGRIYWTNVKRHRESTGTDDLAEAKRILDIRRGRAAEGIPFIRRADTITCAEGFRDLRDHYATTRKRNLREAEFRLQRLEPWFGNKKLVSVTASVRGYVAKRREQGVSDKTISNELEVLITMLRVAYTNHKLLRLPIIEKPTVNNVRQGFFEHEMFKLDFGHWGMAPL